MSNECSQPSLTSNPYWLAVFITALAVASVALCGLPWCELHVVRPIDCMTARILAVLLRLGGANVNAMDTLVLVPGAGNVRGLEIEFGCDGVLAFLLLASAIVPFPVPVKPKVVGLLCGLLVVLVANQVRLIGLFVLMRLLHDEHAFAFFHVYAGQLAAILVVAAVWLTWLSRVCPAEPPN